MTLEGLVTDAILLDGYATVTRYVASHGPCRGITDVSQVTKFDVSNDTIKRLAGTSPAFPTAYMRVFVAPKDFVYGMAPSDPIASTPLLIFPSGPKLARWNGSAGVTRVPPCPDLTILLWYLPFFFNNLARHTAFRVPGVLPNAPSVRARSGM